MSFIGIVLAVFCGIVLRDIVWGTIKTILQRLEDPEERKIGFGDGNESGKKPKGAQMRKIGFGAND